jgi:hypothetical protein
MGLRTRSQIPAQRVLPRQALLAAGGMALGVTLAIALAVPAQAATATDDTAPTTPPPALQAWLAGPTISDTSIAPTLSPAGDDDTTQSVKGVSETDGERISAYQGSVFLWTENFLEWYWTESKITQSKGWQEDGYIFPNTASVDGISKTYSSKTKQNWRATETVGAGVVTPWGAVDVYSSDYTDYFTIHLGGAYSHTR